MFRPLANLLLRLTVATSLLTAIMIVAAPLPARAEESAQSTIDRWEWDVDHTAKQLPSWETPEERAAWGDKPFLRLANDPPPVGPIRNVAEYEPMTKVLIRYPLGIPYSLIAEMHENVQISCVVSSSSYNTARTNFQSNGIDPNTVDWIIAESNSYWTRDYGPWFVFDGNGDLRIIDHKYNRPRPLDDVIPITCGQHWGIPVHTHDLVHTGGNYMTDGYGVSFSTDLVWTENSSMTHAQVFQRMQDYYGLNTYNVVPDISTSGIHHIDCWAKFLDEETIIEKQVSTSHGDYAELEQNATLIASLPSATGRNYRVVRVFCQSIGSGNVASYTNSLILNKKILVPTFNSTTNDNNALQAYRDAAPGYEVIGSYYNGWITDDALHCRTMGIADPEMLRVAHIPIVSWNTYEPIPIRAFIDDRSEAGLKADSLLVYWRGYPVGEAPPAFTASVMAPDSSADLYFAEIPAQADSTTVDYYIHAVDETNRREGMPRTEPAAWYSFLVTLDETSNVATSPGAGRGSLAQNFPNPFRGATTFSFELKYADQVRLTIHDPEGRLVKTVVAGQVGAGRHEYVWDGRNDQGREVAAGTYFYKLTAAGISYARKAVLAR
jgi:agmatine deiminase